ncbi:M1-specific T cell receptor beta chain-like [Scomber scombrus]|uniref:M1-specific T cell receptor beta chain-like n=1 Tax=Scomber scombrus TaxID=13677 RepID=UPI002DD881EA|nr:M1-specific T cell receptor beta chain-like [Scomber scombrus]
MIILFLQITFYTILVSGSSLSDKVKQTPAHMYNKPEEQVNINCSHSIQNYDRILWYKQVNKQLQFLGYFLGYVNYEDGKPEPGVNVTMEGSASKDQICTLIIKEVDLNSSAVYFCAASREKPYTEPAYFGQGTKLTVLETGRTPTSPTVKVLPPSKKECRNQKDTNQRKKTLVCVASGFYPDHVSVEWKVGGEKITKGVATDNAALRNQTTYSITSRLRVPAEEWFNPNNEFTCIVKFYNGNHNEPFYGKIQGEKGMFISEGDGMTREKYLKATQRLKLSYGVFIAKSCVYGAFVVFLVWKLQGKHNK